ncbi:hypothetical protein BGZ98_008772 [Dissophora globulifera]|nr:hypothetical protein BGZ98_008772 [Dissophora globulifera]
MRLQQFSVLAVASLLSLAFVAHAQDANCTAVLSDYAPSVNSNNGLYQKCYTDQNYNAALVGQGAIPNYSDVLDQICNKPIPATCSRSRLSSATTVYMNACSASIDAEAANGNILQTGKIALEIYFAAPIHAIYCGLDPNAVELPPPAINPPAYCLANTAEADGPNSHFITNLALYLTSGTLDASQSPFFDGLDPVDTCSRCSQRALNATVGYLAENLMPRISPFYTPQFVQYWSKFVPAYNTLCKTSIVQTWPEGTLNVTVAMPTALTPPAPAAAQPTAGSEAPVARSKPNSVALILPSAMTTGAAALMGGLLFLSIV